MGYKSAVQILKQAEDLKNRVLRKCDLLNDSQAWTDQQKLQRIYHQALVTDLEYALDKKVEQDLWNIGFKHHITQLQEITRDKKNSQRSEYQTLLTWCLEAASGFYLTLLQELCDNFDIDLPFRRRGSIYGQTIQQFETNLPQSASCLYICQYCLVHLGDIARYRNQRREAETFYKQAIQVSPTSGHPYNQLALLETSQGNKLSTVFYYIRGIAVKNPFPAATTNLLNILNSTVDKENPLERIQTKITVNEFIQIFLCTHTYLHTNTDLNQAEICVTTLNTTMTALVATHSFTSDQLIKITTINLYALKYIVATLIQTELTDDEIKVRQYILDLLAGSLSAFLVPVHTLKNDETLLDYYALPAIKILINWIEIEPKILEDVVFTNRLQIWPSLCKLLNNVAPFLKTFNYDQYVDYPLSEDRDLQGFQPLVKILERYNFKKEIKDVKIEKLVRMKRIVDFGRFLTEFNVNNTKLIAMKKEGDGVIYEPGFTQPDPTNDLLEEMKSFNITIIEKRGGILKPQGSLEKSREERELLTIKEPIIDIKKESIKQKRTKQNVAIQSIFKKLEENKQVKFNVDDNIDDKLTDNQQYTIRPQSFNQNLPGFSTTGTNNQPDYLTTLRNISKPSNQQQFNDKPPPMLPYPNPPNLQSSIFGNSYQFSMNYGVDEASSSTRPPPPPPQRTNSQWWPNSNQQSNYHYPQYNTNLPYLQPDFNKNTNQGSSNDLFNTPWNHCRQSNFDHFDVNHGVSMRQAMLKEATNTQTNNVDNFVQNSPSYSLFNTNNNWTSNLVGQLRKSQDNQINNHLPQHSLFTGQGPQSLAQLLEQQQSQKND